MSTQLPSPVEVFFSYAHEDEELKEGVRKHIVLLQRRGLIRKWHDRMISPGQNWADKIDSHLNTAHVILLLVSADFIASDYCYGVEMKRALERHAAGEARVIPVILRPCDWQDSDFAHLQALPVDGRAVTDWPNPDNAFTDIARGIRRVVEELNANPL